jgi:hypothetical protein
MQEMNDIGEVYKITNIITGLSFIGKTKKNIFNKKTGYKYELDNHEKEASSENFQKNIFLNSALRLYGRENFICQKLIECKLSEIDKIEEIFIRSHKTLFPNGYNIIVFDIIDNIIEKKSRIKKQVSFKIRSNKVILYKITNPITCKSYIGHTISNPFVAKDCLMNHYNEALRHDNTKLNIYWNKEIRKYRTQYSRMKLEIVLECECYQMEAFKNRLIEQHKTQHPNGYNLGKKKDMFTQLMTYIKNKCYKSNVMIDSRESAYRIPDNFSIRIAPNYSDYDLDSC